MSALQARQAALKLQQALVELDMEVELQLKPIKRNLGARGNLVLQTAVLEIDVGFGPTKPATIYIAEDGSVWGKDSAWGAIFTSNIMAFNSSTEWNVERLAISVKAALPNLQRFQESQNHLLAKFIIKRR